MSEASSVLYIRIPEPLRRDLEAWADEEFLKLNAFVVQLLSKAVAQHRSESST
jgi:hypothetical protein